MKNQANQIILMNTIFCNKSTSCFDCKQNCVNKQLIMNNLKLNKGIK